MGAGFMANGWRGGQATIVRSTIVACTYNKSTFIVFVFLMFYCKVIFENTFLPASQWMLLQWKRTRLVASYFSFAFFHSVSRSQSNSFKINLLHYL